MADNLAVTQGSGTTVASDDENSVHYPVARHQCRLDQIVDKSISLSSTTSLTLIPAQGVSIKAAITNIVVSNPTSTQIDLRLLDGATLRYVLPVPGNGGITWQPPIPLVGSANTIWWAQLSGTATAVHVSTLAFTAY